MFPPNPKRNPRMCQCVREQVLLCSRSSSLRTALLRSRGLLPRPTLGRASACWELDGGAEGWRRARQRAQPTDLASKGKNPPLVSVPADSRQALLLCLSCCYLCLSFAYLSWDRWKHGQPPQRARTPPKLSEGRLEMGSVAGSSSISRASRNVLPGELPRASSLILYS